MRAGREKTAIVLIVLALVGCKLPLLQMPYHWDEMGYVATISYYFYDTGFYPIAHLESYHDTLLKRLSVDSGHPTLFYLTVAAMWRIVGPEPWVPRVLALGLAALGVVATALLAEAVAGEALGIFAAAALATNPLYFAQSGTAHLDLPLAALSTMSLWALLRERRTAFLVAATVMLLIKAQAVMFLPAMTLVIVARAWRRGDWASRVREVLVWHAPVGAWLVWKIWSVLDTGSLVSINAYNTAPLDRSNLLWGLARGTYFGLLHRGSFFFAAFAVLGTCMLLWRRLRGLPSNAALPWEAAVLVLLPLFTMLLVQAPMKNNGARYYLTTLPLLIVAGCWGLRQLGIGSRGAVAMVAVPVLAFQIYAWHGMDPLLLAIERSGIVHVKTFREGGKYWSAVRLVTIDGADVTDGVVHPDALPDGRQRAGNPRRIELAQDVRVRTGAPVTVRERVGAEVAGEFYAWPLLTGHVTAVTRSERGTVMAAVADDSGLHAVPPALDAGISLPNDSHENNMDYLEVVKLHKSAMSWLVEHRPGARVLSNWPGIFEAKYPFLGYTQKPFPVLYLAENIDELKAGDFDVLYAPDDAMFPGMHLYVVRRFGLVLLDRVESPFGRVDIWGHPASTKKK